MNYCRECEQNFGGITAFDAHRVGVHEYTYSEGAKMDPVREDGRRCLSLSELEGLASEDGSARFGRNKRGEWSVSDHITNEGEYK